MYVFFLAFTSIYEAANGLKLTSKKLPLGAIKQSKTVAHSEIGTSPLSHSLTKTYYLLKQMSNCFLIPDGLIAKYNKVCLNMIDNFLTSAGGRGGPRIFVFYWNPSFFVS